MQGDAVQGGRKEAVTQIGKEAEWPEAREERWEVEGEQSQGLLM